MPSPSLVLLRTQSDARLVALARDGHERAFEAIVDRYRRQLLRACRRVLPEARAEDALQQALMAAWRGIRRGDDVRDLRAWLHRIAHNTSLNLLRQAGYDYDELQDSLRIADAPDEELERRAVVRQTLAGLAALPERQREALMAIAVEGRSQDEVAGDLGLSTGAVRQLVHRARSSLRAAATAVMPLPLAGWVAGWGPRGELTGRIAELSAGTGGAGGAALLAKAGTLAVIAGGVVAGPAIVQKRTHGPQAPAAATATPSVDREQDGSAAREPAVARRIAVSLPVRGTDRSRPQPSGDREGATRRATAPQDDADGRERGGRDDDDREGGGGHGAAPVAERDEEADEHHGSGDTRHGSGGGELPEPQEPNETTAASGTGGEHESDQRSGPSPRTAPSGNAEESETPAPTPEPADTPESGSGSGGESSGD
jgi:RNA polymerase sigma factor (sigma-70 family)